MAVKIKRQPKEWEKPYEHCCKCRAPTPYWYEPRDVPLCRACSKVTNVGEIPTKAQWWAEEEPDDRADKQ